MPSNLTDFHEAQSRGLPVSRFPTPVNQHPPTVHAADSNTDTGAEDSDALSHGMGMSGGSHG